MTGVAETGAPPAPPARKALGPDGVVPLAVLERSGLIESRHSGAAVLTRPDGTLALELGDGDADVWGRSSLKPFQALAALRAGAPLDGEELVLATASHAGTPAHIAVVERVLDAAGAVADDLRCPHDWPLDRRAMLDAHAAGHGTRRIAMNCSGKHAAFLLACRVNGFSTGDYLDRQHPMQLLVAETIADYTGQIPDRVGVDGCGAPVFATGLTALARGIGRIAGARERGDDPLAATLAGAILDHPWAIDGPGRSNTVVIDRLGVIAKLGAEGVLVVGMPDGTGFAMKMLDGNLRATTTVALDILAAHGLVDPDESAAVAAETAERVLGGGQPVGGIRSIALAG
ncbi:asparaginase [Marisediminicola sp. LYQ134]|uniref:asparaginase n=1 Tax=Marisediminicola sp. LYQ134 TaxID=3391061 RepID=UPI003982F1E2